MMTTAVQIYAEQKTEIKCTNAAGRSEAGEPFSDCLKSVTSKLKSAGGSKGGKTPAVNKAEENEEEKDVSEVSPDAVAMEVGAAGISAVKLGNYAAGDGQDSDPEAAAAADPMIPEPRKEIGESQLRSEAQMGAEIRGGGNGGAAGAFAGLVQGTKAAAEKTKPETASGAEAAKAAEYKADQSGNAANKAQTGATGKTTDINTGEKSGDALSADTYESVTYTRLQWTVNRLREEQTQKGSESPDKAAEVKDASLSEAIQPEKTYAQRNGESASAGKVSSQANASVQAVESDTKTQGIESLAAGEEIGIKVTENTAAGTNVAAAEEKSEAHSKGEAAAEAASSKMSAAKPDAYITGARDTNDTNTTPAVGKTELKEASLSEKQDKSVFKIQEGAKSSEEKATSAGSKNEDAGNKASDGEKTLASAVPFAEVYSGKENGITSAVSGEKVVPQIARAVKGMTSKDGGKFTMELSPRELGKITVEMKYSQGKLNVVINAASDETAKALKAQLGELKTALTANKVEIMSVDVSGRQSSDLSFSDMKGSGERYGGSGRGGSQGGDSYYRSYGEDRDSKSPEAVYGWNQLLNYLV